MRPECATASARYRLVLPRRPPSGQIGDRLGHGTGNSLELLDFRDYVPGDDLRHLDWRGYARTDRLQVRLFREEIAPAFELVLDTSASLAVTNVKAQALGDLAAALASWGKAAGGRARWFACGGNELDPSQILTLEGTDRDLLPRVALRPRSLRVLISDFLFAADPGPAIRKLASGAAQLWVVHLLDPDELEPKALGPHTLVDAESAVHLDVALGPAVIARYCERLQRLCALVAHAAQAAGGKYVRVKATEPAAMFQDSLLPQGLIEPV